ncbi:hypothetical protein GCM10010216_64950 [Streptomyces flaveolus]|nr:hypothetical protein GCM10010216_64950 [Streptomyces flaveolus]
MPVRSDVLDRATSLVRLEVRAVRPQSFTMHGTITLLLFATPTCAGFANAIRPLQIGSAAGSRVGGIAEPASRSRRSRPVGCRWGRSRA